MKKKKKYWVIPLIVFATMIISKIIQVTLSMLEVKLEILNTLFNLIFLICGFAVIPSIILAIILGTIKK